MTMTVSDLRAALEGLPGDLPVVLAKDVEGNDHSPLEDAEQAMYLPDSTWSGNVYLTPEGLAARVSGGEDGWDLEDDAAPDDAFRVLLLGPVN